MPENAFDEAAACGEAAPPLVFGPVPSRRLGRSIGINNIPPKVCSYSCVYCQVGPTMDRADEPREFYPPERIATEVAAHVDAVRSRGEAIDHLTFVPDGEPTLDARLGESIESLRPLGIPIAVISNGSLLARSDVADALGRADWVSVKVDAADEPRWRRVNRPHPSLDLGAVQRAIRSFAAGFTGTLVSETMLVAGLNDETASTREVGRFLRSTGIGTAYLAIPTRPTPYADITAPDEATMLAAFEELRSWVPRVELLIGYEGDAFAASGDPRRDLTSITAVHPMRASAVAELLERSAAGNDVLDELIADGVLARVTYRGETYFVRRFAPSRS